MTMHAFSPSIGVQIWSLTKCQKFELGVSQRRVDRSILGVQLSDRVQQYTALQKTNRCRRSESHQTEMELGRIHVPYVEGTVGIDHHGVDPT